MQSVSGDASKKRAHEEEDEALTAEKVQKFDDDEGDEDEEGDDDEDDEEEDDEEIADDDSIHEFIIPDDSPEVKEKVSVSLELDKAAIDVSNIITGKRRRVTTERYVDPNLAALYLSDVPKSELKAALGKDFSVEDIVALPLASGSATVGNDCKDNSDTDVDNDGTEDEDEDDDEDVEEDEEDEE